MDKQGEESEKVGKVRDKYRVKSEKFWKSQGYVHTKKSLKMLMENQRKVPNTKSLNNLEKLV